MAESIRQPDELVLIGNIAENWRKFKQEFELYMTARKYRKQAIEVFNTFALNAEEKGNYVVVVGTFNSYCNPKTNDMYERYVFHRRNQGESIEQFVTDLKIKAPTRQFENLKDSMIHDRLVLGITSQRERERLLLEDDLTLAKAIQICAAAEARER